MTIGGVPLTPRHLRASPWAPGASRFATSGVCPRTKWMFFHATIMGKSSMNGGFNGKMIYKSANGGFNGNIWEYHLRNEGHVWLPEVIISAIPGWHILFTVALSFSTPFSAGFSAFSPGKDLRLATFRNLSATPAKLFRNHLKSCSHACFRAFMETEKTYQKWSTNLGAHRFTSFRKRAKWIAESPESSLVCRLGFSFDFWWPGIHFSSCP